MLLLRFLSTAERMLINLVLNLIRGIRHKDTRILIRGAHLRLRTLKGGEELGVD